LILDEFYWSLRDTYFPTWCFIQTYISVIIRCFGVLLITFHRYLTMCRSHTRIEQFVNVSHRWTLPFLQWIIPLIYSIPFFTITDVQFDSKDSFNMLAEQEEITLATFMTAVFLTVSFSMCSFCYGSILKFLINNRYNANVAIKRELRLCVELLGLFVAHALLFVFHVMLMIFSLERNDGPVFTLRSVFPVITGFMSYINVWLMFIFNTDMRNKILHIISCHENMSCILNKVIVKISQGTETTRIRTFA
ncbi:hypothetical protein DICVIV_06695, partial [Dictyocaulus viviparus]